MKLQLKNKPFQPLESVGQWARRKSAKLGQLALATLMSTLLAACGGGSSSSELPNTTNLAPANVKLLEVSSSAIGQITASWLPATDDATPASQLTYQLHASTSAGFTPTSTTKVFEGKATYQATVTTGLTSGSKYHLKLVVIDGLNASTSSEALSVVVSNTSATLNAGVKVTTLSAQQVASVSGNQVTLPSGSTTLQAGQFIASAEGNNGTGYLKKIESVSTSNGSTVLQTRDAAVNEVVSDVSLSSSFKLASVPKEIASTAQQVGLLKTAATAPSASMEYAWQQSGYRYSAPQSTAPSQTGLPAAWGQSLQAGLIQGAAIDKSGTWGRLYMPGSLTVTEGETANFNIHTYIINASEPRLGQRRKICRIGFGAMKSIGEASKPSAVTLSAGAGAVNNQDDYRPTHIFYPSSVKAGAGTASPNPYTVDVTLYIEELGQDCYNQTFWDEKVTLPLSIYVTNDADALRENETLSSAFSGSGDFKVTNDINMSFQPTITFDAVMAGAKLGTARIQLDAAPLVEQTLKVTASAQGTLDKTQTILPTRKFYKVYMTPAGVPIVVSGAYRIDMTIKGHVTGAIDATEKLTLGFNELSYGLEYKNGQYKVISQREPIYRLSMGGKGKAQASLEIALQPRLELSAYEALTGTVVLEPYMNARAGIEGHVQQDIQVDFNQQQLNMAADADYRLTQGALGGGVRTKLGVNLGVWDFTLVAWPAAGQLQSYDLIAQTDFWGIPQVSASSTQDRHSTDTRALAFQAQATEISNPLKSLFSNLPDSFVTWANWTDPRIVPQLTVPASSYSLLPSTEAGLAWAVFTQPGTYTVRQGGYSSLGTWARQYVETTIEIKDSNNNGIPDWWEQRYGLTGTGAAIAAADTDGDGMSNLQEWQQGRDPTLSDGSNTLNATSLIATVGETVQLWLTQAWSNIKSVVFSFADGVASFATKTAAVANGESAKLSGSFTKTGPQTVTATYKDASGNTVGSGTLVVNVMALATITNVQTDNGTAIGKNSTTTDSTPKVSGTVSAALANSMQVLVYDNGSSNVIGTATVTGTNWTLQITTPLVNGSHSLSAAVYHAGYMVSGPASPVWPFTVQGAAVAGGKLPHSGITASQCYAAGSDTLVDCSTSWATSLNALQDGHRASINAMSYSQVGSYSKEECVKDNITGLIWEGKTASGTRAGSNTYTNYDSTNSPQYWNGSAYVNPTPAQISASTNSMGYVAAVNAMALCGYTDWRLPTVEELQTLVDYSKPSPTINTAWFPNTSSGWYRTSSPYLGGSDSTWLVFFNSGVVDGGGGGGLVALRLVRASQ